MSIRLIVNADDYGHTEGVSSGIREAHVHGIVTSTSAMLNKPAVAAALEAANDCPRLGIGVHLVLTSGSPLLPVDKVPSLVTTGGKFYNEEGFILHIDQIDLDEVWAEWNTQIEKFISLTGQPPDHLDSHHHSSYFTPGLYEKMLKLAAQLNCPIRKPKWATWDNSSSDLDAPFTPTSIQRMRELTAQFAPRTTGGFIDSFYDTGATRAHLLSILADLAEDKDGMTFELMSHPAIVDDTLRSTSTYNEMRARERMLLEDPDIAGYLRTQSIELINFSAL